MNKLKQLLRRWLGVENDRRELDAVRENLYRVDLYKQQSIDALDKRLSKTEDIIGLTARAGFDHHIRQPSWIVVAWRDKDGRERVHFYEVHEEYITQINDMLRRFKRENVIVDTHPQIAPQFKW